MISNFKLNQAKFLPENNNGVCYVASIDWCGNNLRGHKLTREYYTDDKVDKWFPFIEQQKEYSKDRRALNLNNYQYLEELLHAVDKQIVVREIKDRDLVKAIKNLAPKHALLIGISFTVRGNTYGHAVAFYNDGNGTNGKLFFDPNQGQFSGDNAEPVAITVNEVLLGRIYAGYIVSMLAELQLA